MRDEEDKTVTDVIKSKPYLRIDSALNRKKRTPTDRLSEQTGNRKRVRQFHPLDSQVDNKWENQARGQDLSERN